MIPCCLRNAGGKDGGRRKEKCFVTIGHGIALPLEIGLYIRTPLLYGNDNLDTW